MDINSSLKLKLAIHLKTRYDTGLDYIQVKHRGASHLVFQLDMKTQNSSPD